MSDRCEFPKARQYKPEQNINLITMNDSFTWKYFFPQIQFPSIQLSFVTKNTQDLL